MSQVTFHEGDGSVIRSPVDGLRAKTALRELGIASGQWVLQANPVSQTPQLTYARELRQLRQLCDSVYTDRVRQRPGALRGDPRDHHSVAWPDQRDEHTHNDAEVRVILGGRARWVVRAPAVGGWITVTCEAGDWLALPAGLPHAFEASETRGVDLLRLFARPGGWVTERTSAEVPLCLQRWSDADLPAERWAHAA